MEVVAKFDDLEEWKQFCVENNLTIESLTDSSVVCYDKWHTAFNPNGWFNVDIQAGEVDWDWQME